MPSDRTQREHAPMPVPNAVRTATEVHAGSRSAQSAVRMSLARIAALDRRLQAFQTVRGRDAVTEARALDTRGTAHPAGLRRLALAGVPIAVQDVVPVVGEVTHAGSRAAANTPAARDHPLVGRLRDAGAVVVGLTRVPEAALWPATDGEGYVTANPWNRHYSAGGSAGGSAAAVAAGMVPAAHGTDALGAIRIAAAACGLVGVKPGRGVVTPVALAGGDWSGLVEHGVLATTVQDAALLLATLAARPDLAHARGTIGGQRVAVSVRPPVPGLTTDPAVVRATFEVAACLRRAGHRVERAGPGYPASGTLAIFLRWLAAADDQARALTGPGPLQRRTTRHAAFGRIAGRAIRPEPAESWRARVAEFFATFDVLLTPVLAGGPLPALAWSQRTWSANVMATLTSTGGFTAPWNLAGLPAVAVPAGRHPRTRVPIGVQLIGPPGSEGRLLAVAADVERSRPWQRVAEIAP